MENYRQIKFDNTLKPNSQFDLGNIEELLRRDLEFKPTQLHKINFYNLLFITEGSGYHTIDFTDFKYEKGTLITIRKDQLHRFHFSKNVKGKMLFFTEEFLASHYSKKEVSRSFQLFNELLSHPRIKLNQKDFSEILEHIEDIQLEYLDRYDEFSESIIRSSLHILVSKIYRVKSKVHKVLNYHKYLDDFSRFQKLVESNCFEFKKVHDYANHMSCTPKTLNNISRRIIDKPAKQLIDEILITQIKRLLINTHMPITEIAYTAGFNEPSNLYRFFKKYTGSTPEQFRKAY
ncbi:MAG: helix-turn-helix transcriptional regulator [Bacteroidota bacterium]